MWLDWFLILYMKSSGMVVPQVTLPPYSSGVGAWVQVTAGLVFCSPRVYVGFLQGSPVSPHFSTNSVVGGLSTLNCLWVWMCMCMMRSFSGCILTSHPGVPGMGQRPTWTLSRINHLLKMNKEITFLRSSFPVTDGKWIELDHFFLYNSPPVLWRLAVRILTS